MLFLLWWLGYVIITLSIIILLAIFIPRFQGVFVYLHLFHPLPACLFSLDTYGKPDSTVSLQLRTPDGETLGAWLIHKPGFDFIHSSTPYERVILHLHGNAASRRHTRRIRSMKVLIDTLAADALLSIDYRGFADSSGTPTEAGFISDALTAYNFLTQEKAVKEVIVWGHSLGSGVATALASHIFTHNIQPPPLALFLEAPFLSMRDAAMSHWVGYPIRILPLPIRRFVLKRIVHKFNTAKRISKGLIKCPLMILHSKDDGIINVEQGMTLYRLATDQGMNTRISILEDAGHNCCTFDPTSQTNIRAFI